MSNLSCPGCQAEYDATGYDPGDQFQCPSCQAIVTVPGGEEAVADGPRMPRMKSRGTTRRTASKAPMQRERATSKMRTVNDAVGMGMTMPGQDPRNARRAQAAPPPADGGNKNMTFIFVGLGAVMVIGGVIFLVKGAGGSDEGKKKKKPNTVAEEKADEKGSSGTPTDTTPKPEDPARKPPVDDGWGFEPKIIDHVSQVVNLLKGKPEDVVFWKTSAPLLQYGRQAIPPLVERFSDPDPDVAAVARAVVERATRKNLPPDLFSSQPARAAMLAEVRHWWINTESGKSCQLVSEAEYINGRGAASNPPPDPGGSPPNPGGNPPPRNVGGGAIARDLPQRLMNFRRGTAEQRDTELREIRSWGKGVISHLIGHLSNEDYDLAGAAHSVLQELTKQDFGRLPAEERKDFVKKWEDWWKSNEATFNM
jgi:hypothetical protein